MLQKYQWLFTSNAGRAEKDQCKPIIITNRRLQRMPPGQHILFLQEWQIIIKWREAEIEKHIQWQA